MAKYAPANDAGEKPYVVEYSDWGRSKSRLVYAADATAARWRLGRQSVGQYVVKVRRALMDEIEEND